VSILQRRLVNYRVGLFERLHERCDDHGIELRLVYGQPSPNDAKRNDSASLPWADEVDARWFSLRGSELLWQPCPRQARNADLVILTQENRILSNLPFLASRPLSSRRLAYWGHGRNLQAADAEGPKEKWKELLSTRVDWWFGYTGQTRDILTGNGFPAERITVLDNAIDNEAFERDLEAVTDGTLAERRAEIDLAPDGRLGFYCGALYEDKRIDLMVEVAERIHRQEPGFRLVVVGDGPDRPRLERLMAPHPWAHWVGSKTGPEKAAWFRLADVILSPGLVGLHVLDSFAAGVPLFTTRSAKHGPEIDYLEHGVNGFVLDEDDPDRFAAEVVALLRDPIRLAGVVEAGRKAASRYTLANMAENFVAGIVECLDRDPR
jgi:glycosyltransferase involved in cell wall biosynthesis